MGIPLLHPYANRLSRDRFDLGQREVDLARAGERVARDPNGLAIHGLLAGTPGWEIAAREAGADGARLAARYDAGAHQEVAAAFPFPHVIALELSLEDATLSIRTRVEPTGDVAVPISYGFHPYLRLPDVPRSDWEIRVPVREQVILDERNLPTGERRSVSVESGPLGDRTFDDVYSGVEAGTVFSVAGGGRRIEVEFEDGYPIAVVYAPDNDDVVCFEPMTAPTNAMVDGAPELRFVDPGDSQSAAWSLRIVEQ
jgi:galactose mutarotase-like enzyme